ncbi:MAG TPA: hypothetical protein VF290_24505 [Pyrinomonadaceae bacterium]
MKSLIAACFVLVVSAHIVDADIAKPKEPEKAAAVRKVLHTSLEIATDPKAYEAKLQITESDLKSLRAALDGAAGNTPVAASIAQSPTRTIIAGLLMFLAVSIAGVLFARSSSFGRAQKVVGAVILVVAVIGVAAIMTRGNAGPPGSYRWRNLPQALAEGKPTAGGLDIEIIPDDARTGANMRLIIPLKKNSPGEE